MNFIKINNITLPAPTKYEISKNDVNGEDSLSETGILHRNRVRSGVYSLDVNWRVSESDLKTILDTIKSSSFTAVFFDPVSSAEKSCTMYAKEPVFSCIGFEDEESWWNIAVKLLEF